MLSLKKRATNQAFSQNVQRRISAIALLDKARTSPSALRPVFIKRLITYF